MSILANEIKVVKIQDVKITEENLTVDLEDGRIISVPIAWYPRLWHGSQQEREHWRLIGGGVGIHWPELDEDISVEGIIMGRRSGESQRSLKRWLEKRNKAGKGTDRSQPA